MSVAAGTLKLLTFPQRWDPGTDGLRVRILCLPRTFPDQPLAPGLPDFAHADLRFEGQLVAGLDRLPRVVDAVPTGPLAPAHPPVNKVDLFAALAASIPIDTAPSTPASRRPRFRMPTTDSYRERAGNRELSRDLAGDREYACALQDALAAQPSAPVIIEPRLRWGQVLALALRQPVVAEGLGLVTEVTISPPEGLWRRGGWVFSTLHSTSDGAGVPGLVASFAAYLPPLEGGRSLFAPVLFPVDSTTLVGDQLVADAERYADGHARMVHAEQVKDDTGDAVRLAWDDEQVAGWLNRQLDPDHEAPLGTQGFRLDVREVGTHDWTSLCRLRSVGDLTLGPHSLGAYDGEGLVEVIPLGLSPGAGEYWLPAWFATWRGTSVVAPDPDLRALHQDVGIGWGAGTMRTRLGASVLEPYGLQAVPLRYGHDYEFRVRLVDLTAGGPDAADPVPDSMAPDDNCTVTVQFRRRKRPGAVDVVHRVSEEEPVLVVERPRLAYPEILFTGDVGFDVVRDELVAQPGRQSADPGRHHSRGLGLPDPDVDTLRIAVEAGALTGDGAPWHRLLETERRVPHVPTEHLRLEVRFSDHSRLDTLPPADDDGPLDLPTARDLRLILTPLGRDDADYFATSASADGVRSTNEARTGVPTTVEFHARSKSEPDLLGSAELRSFFLRLPPADSGVARPAERLAQELNLELRGLTLTGRPGRRTVFGASAGLPHTLAPERSALTLSSDGETCSQWINAIRVSLERDWTWRGLAESGIEVHRTVQRGNDQAGDPVLVGTIQPARVVPSPMTAGLGPDDPRDPGRQRTDLVFLDALDPRPDPHDTAAGQLPTELRVTYSLTPVVVGGDAAVELLAPIRLPVTTPPAQLPRLVSAGLALSEFSHADDYSSTEPRRRRLWLELADAPDDPGDSYFVRVLAVAPDPLLTDVVDTEEPEPGLPIDPEWVRAIAVDQPADALGRYAMQPLEHRAEEGLQYVVPLPPGVEEASPELFGMYTYEIRVGHADDRWCTAQGRWGPPLRIAGVQHPAPPLFCQAARTPESIKVRALYAVPLHRGAHVRPAEPHTQLWALLYARVQQADGQGWRNLLLLRHSLTAPRQEVVMAGRAAEPEALYGVTDFALEVVGTHLHAAGLPRTTPLHTLVVETFTRPAFEDPLGLELGNARLLRVSPLIAVPDTC